ncbi:sensor histidine kinase [Terrimonas pollutisoli]|uniref:sensor histidine kinase n=1 Tax=Terrimonas pollutisoli TaxID=3034147 RepID=UPI0023ED2586|nr:sensor histidine kinase [Terrimonas sp. H1YJ31]
MRRIIQVYILFLLPAGFLQAQQHLVDSIRNELKQQMPDSNRAMSMMRLAIDYEAVDTAKAYQAYRDAIKFASEKKLYYQLGRAYQNQSVLFSTAANYEQATVSLDHAIANYEKSDHPKSKLWEANAFNDKAGILKAQNEFKQAVEYYLKSISLMEELKESNGLINKYANLSTLFGDMGENLKQIEYAHKAVSAAKEQGVRQNLFMAYFILANAYSVKEENPSAKKFLDSSTIYFNEAENADNIDILLSYYLVAAQVFKKLNQPDSAFYFFRKSYDVSKSYNYSYGKAEAQLQMGAIAIIQKKYSEAEKYLLAGIEEAKAVNYYGMLDEGYKYLSDVYAVTGRYKKAYEYFQKYKEVNDSVLSMESRKYGKELEQKYESAKKDKQIVLQKSQLQERRILNYVFIGSAVILLLISLLSYRNYKQKQKIQQQRINELEKEKQLSATEAVLKGEEQERTRLAKDLHDGLGGMLSGIKYSFQTMKGNLIMTPDNHQAFERSMDMLDSSIKEMRRVAHNMMPEALVKFGLDTALKDFCNDINQSGALRVTYQSIGMENAVIEQTTAITIYRIVQELINNTMKHASAKTAIVQVTKTDGNISITVEDDGKGFDPVILKGGRGIGWSNIQSRIEYLKGKLDVQSEPGKGTSVLIELKA